MIKEENESRLDYANCNHDDVFVISHKSSQFLEGNIKYISLHSILCEIYDKICKLNMKQSKSFSYSNCNVLIENFPLITYGVNVVKRSNIHIFLKRVTNLEQETERRFSSEISRKEINDLENIIFSDLQLFISYYNYFKIQERRGFFVNLMRFFYQPILTIKTYLNDKTVLNEVNEKFSMNSKEEALNFIHGVDRKIEAFLCNAGGEKYCNLEDRNVNSVDLMIYCAYKAQEELFGYQFLKDNFNLRLSKILSDAIDKFQSPQTYILVPGNNYIVPKVTDERNFHYLDYVVVSQESQNELNKKLILTSIFFGVLFYLKLFRKR